MTTSISTVDGQQGKVQIMGWAVKYDDELDRDIGYGVPASCDHPGCGEEIDRGISYRCGGYNPNTDECGCGLFFCAEHQSGGDQLCERCENSLPKFEPTPDLPIWVEHKLTHASWQTWRDQNVEEVDRLTRQLADMPQH